MKNDSEHRSFDGGRVFQKNPNELNYRQKYFDYMATTPVDPRVLEVMFDAFANHYGNSSSRSHSFGWHSETLCEKAREEVATMIGASSDEIIFTSGATEANNLAIKGVCGFYGKEKNHIITCITEHKCVIESCRAMQADGFEVTFLKPKSDGLIDLVELEKAITPKTLLISIMGVNNEIGVIQDLHAIGNLARKNGAFFHTDCAQAFGKINLDVRAMNIDLMSISGHKIYGPKGIGALYVGKHPRVRLKPLFSGGGQERGLRSGTLPTPLVIGFGEATKIAKAEMGKNFEYIKKISDKFINEMLQIPETYLNGSKENRYPGNVNISFVGIEGESLMMALKDIAVSSGSACTSASLEPSYVLKSLGVSDELAHSSIRISFSPQTTEQDIDYLINLFRNAVNKLREMSPLWEMIQEGVDLNSVQWSEH